MPRSRAENTCSWPAERVSEGIGHPFNGMMLIYSEIILKLETSPILEPIGSRYVIGPAGQENTTAFENVKR